MPCRCIGGNSDDGGLGDGTCSSSCSNAHASCNHSGQCHGGGNPPGGGPGGGGSGGGGCFQEGTKIDTVNGIKSIEDVKVGDIVKSYNTKKNELTESKVYETFKHEDNSDGLLLNGIIKTTTNHPFYSNGTWVEAGDLKLGDKILHVDGEEHLVKTIDLMNYSTTVYNFEVEDTHNYFAEGYLVHNKGTGDEPPRTVTYQTKGRRRGVIRPNTRNWNHGTGDTPMPTYATGGPARLRGTLTPHSCYCNDQGFGGNCVGACTNMGAPCTNSQDCIDSPDNPYTPGNPPGGPWKGPKGVIAPKRREVTYQTKRRGGPTRSRRGNNQIMSGGGQCGPNDCGDCSCPGCYCRKSHGYFGDCVCYGKSNSRPSVYRRGGQSIGNQTLGFGMPGSQCTSDVQCTKGRCQKSHWTDTYGRCVGHGGGTRRRSGRGFSIGEVRPYGEGGGVHHWNGLPNDMSYGMWTGASTDCPGGFSDVDEFGNNICYDTDDGV